MTKINTLGWIDYLVIAVVLCISIGIGIYYRFSGGRQKTMEEYFVASGSMSVVPVAIAMVASFLSGIALLGSSAENYIYGTQFVVVCLAYILSIPIICYGFLPVFFKLQATSAYEYLEKRFGVKARMMASFVYWMQMLLYSGVVLYAPSLAIEATTGTSKIASIIIIGLVCAFYSSLGGIRAVLITDVFQCLLMFVAIFLIIGTAANDVGGLEQIWEIARQGQRLEFDNIDLDPTVRNTWWSLTLGGLIIFLSLYGVNQVQIQRMLTLKNMQASQRAVWLSLPILLLLTIAICFSGLAMYSRYYNCDPLLQKRISSPDMLMPLYVMDTMSNIPGLPGLFVAGIFSASLSTISGTLNSLAAITLEDYIKPTSLTISGVIGGPLVGMFTLGMGTESATESGAIAGALTAYSFLFWIVFGQPRPIPPVWPTTIEGCDNNITNITMSVFRNATSFSKSTGDSSYFYLYRISYLWYPFLGFIITFLLGLFVSNLSRLFLKNQNNKLDINLFFPVVARRIHFRRCKDEKNEVVLR
ncbi:PREDICTED: putative sodium-dependent multivitamin transporter isoform X2 [Wasmannia auropunctata]|uniref:putative sodium-dependent multivitamin transporter isoform X2 n=1 Tax=Wasmannia auropunctata TaxID=64793 RepID=UPI0005EE6B0E|nr:PREDICTED: putative sodium-dependent multivitamin transporter isoform X2 [Wasmannia auropunctata]